MNQYLLLLIESMKNAARKLPHEKNFLLQWSQNHIGNELLMFQIKGIMIQVDRGHPEKICKLSQTNCVSMIDSLGVFRFCTNMGRLTWLLRINYANF